MFSLPPFGLPGSWYKGSLHTHTSESDGRLTPAENLRWHADHGYDFVALTDHNRLTDPLAFNPNPPLLAIPSAEINARRMGVEYHILSVGIERMPIAPNSDPQAVIDAVNAAGGLCFIGHPYWNDHTLDDLLPLRGYLGIEIFNTGCWLEIQKGHALTHWDGLLRRGVRPYGLAVDDSHFAIPDHGRGWVVVRADRLDQASILAALRKGDFYASMGPEITLVQVEGHQVTVQCSPVRSIYVIGDAHHCPHAAQAWDGVSLTEATFRLPAQQRYLRVEVVDFESRSAWTNAYFLSELTEK